MAGASKRPGFPSFRYTETWPSFTLRVLFREPSPNSDQSYFSFINHSWSDSLSSNWRDTDRTQKRATPAIFMQISRIHPFILSTSNITSTLHSATRPKSNASLNDVYQPVILGRKGPACNLHTTCNNPHLFFQPKDCLSLICRSGMLKRLRPANAHAHARLPSTTFAKGLHKKNEPPSETRFSNDVSVILLFALR
jgi:hypothetical protein